eukprot:591704_1
MAAIFCIRRNMILERINEADSIDDLIPLLHAIELTAIQDILQQKVKQMNEADISNLFCSSLSIEKILPTDIIGHITSFHNMSQTQSVSKTFKKCYHQNKQKQIQKREMHIASKLNRILDTTTTYVVDPNRTELNDNEKRLKYHGPMHDLLDVIINTASNGDTILVHDGTYGCYSTDIEINKCLRIIGTGDNVLIQCNIIGVNNHVYFKDVKIKIHSEVDEGINVSPDCALFMEQSIVDFTLEGICTSRNCVVDINNCKFNGGDHSNEAISIRQKVQTVSITHCMFQGCGRGDCDSNGESYDCIATEKDENFVGASLKLIGNLFVNNAGNPIGSWDGNTPRIYHHNVFFEGNKMKRGGIFSVTSLRDIMWNFIEISDESA